MTALRAAALLAPMPRKSSVPTEKDSSALAASKRLVTPKPGEGGSEDGRSAARPTRRKAVAVGEDSAPYAAEAVGGALRPDSSRDKPAPTVPSAKPSALLDTRVVYCGDNLDQLQKLPPACVDLIYIDPPFNSNRNYEVFWGETKETRAFEDRHESTRAYIDYMRPRCVELARVLKKTGSFYYHCDWHASRHVKVMFDVTLEREKSE